MDVGGLRGPEVLQDTPVVLFDEYPLVCPEPPDALIARRRLHASARKHRPWWRRLWQRLLH